MLGDNITLATFKAWAASADCNTVEDNTWVKSSSKACKLLDPIHTFMECPSWAE